MADNKLLGVLELNPGKVLDTINQVNSALQNLGKGVDLNLTNILNAKVNSQLKELKQQIDDINKAAATPAAGSGSGKVSQIKQINELLTQQYNAQIKLANLENRSNVNQNQIQRQQNLLNEAQMRLGFYEQEKVEQQQSLTRFQNMQKKIDDARAASADRAIQMQKKNADEQKAQQEKAVADEIEANQRAANEIAKQQEKVAKQKAEIDKKAEQEYQESIDAQIKATEKAAQEQLKISQQREKEQDAMIAKAAEQANKWYDSQVEDAAKLLKENADIEKKLLSGTAGPNETNALNERLAANKQALDEYGDSIIDAAKADASVVKAQQDVAMANAQAQDRILKENQKAQEEAAKAAEANAKKMQDYRKQWANYAVSALGAASLAVLKKQWTEAVSYATKYYDALNEIRVVTNMNQQDADQFGQKMRDIAQDMKVTSTELSEAAITFFRQGLEPEDVEDRLRWVTEYAKVAHMEFNDAAELMTAAINTMGDSIQESGIENVVEHIADVWLYLGDNAATSGEEIGKAMQKASASATEFGLSFEWLGTYIAVVAEQTRQAPEVIGNAFNTMMARMHQIKQNGFNDEDTTKLNDVAKALATINVELMDNGQWRAMNDIYSDIADKWGEMDAKQRGYIATTMAGTRQQNVFYALMNDMSKGIEGGSRAWELYTGAMNAAGTATQKYAVYQESIEASQADMQNSLEQLYSNVMTSDMIKDFYEFITAIVDGLNKMGGAAPVAIAGLVGVTAAIVAVNAAMNPLVVVMTAAAAVLGTLIGLGGLAALFGGGDDSAVRYEKATENYKEAGKNIKELQGLQNTLEGVWTKQASGVKLSSSELSQYNTALEKVASLSPEAASAVEALTSGLGDQAEAINKVKTALEEELEAEKAKQQYAAEQRLNNWTADQSIFEYENYEIAKASGDRILEELKKFGYDGQTKSSLASAAVDAYVQGLSSDRELSSAFVQYFSESWRNASDELLHTADWYNEEEAELLGQKLYRNLIGDVLGGSEYQDSLTTQMNDLINVALEKVGDDIDLPSALSLREKLKEVIIGPDGVLSAEDFSTDPLFGVIARVKAVLKEFSEELDEEFEELSISEQLAEVLGMTLEEFSESFILPDEAGEFAAITDDMVQSLYEFIKTGEDVDKVLGALSVSKNWQEFALNVGFIKEAGKSLTEGGEASSTISKYAKSITEFVDSADDLTTVIDALKEGEPVKLQDLLDIANAHPEILGLLGDVTALQKKLEELRDEAKQQQRESARSMIMNSEAAFASSSFGKDKELARNGITTFQGAQDYFDGIINKEGVGRGLAAGYRTRAQGMSAEIDALTDSFIALTEAEDNAGQSANETVKAYKVFAEQVENLSKAQDAIKALTEPEGYDLSKAVGARETLAELFGLDMGAEDFTEQAQAATENLAETVNATAEEYGFMGEAAAEAAQKAKEAAEEVAKAEEERLKGYKELLQEMQNAEVNAKASKLNYAGQLGVFEKALSAGGAKSVVSMWEDLGKTNKEMQTAIQQRYPQFAKAVAQAAVATGDLTKETSALEDALKESQEQATKLTKLDQAKYLKDTASEVKKLTEGSGDLAKAFEEFYSESEDVIAAQEEYAKVSEQAGGVSQATADDVQKLVKALGWPAESILNNWDLVGEELTNAGTEIDDLYAQLQKEAILRITGTSEADFSNIQNGLFAVASDAEATLAALAALGAYEVDEEELEGQMPVFDTVNGRTVQVDTIRATGTQKILRFPEVKGRNTTGGGNTKGGGGGGGGGNKQKTTSASTKALDRMERVQTLQDHTRSLYSAQAGYYEQTGQIDLVIKYHQKEMEAIRDKNATLEENIAELEDWIAKKREEIAALDEASEEYETAQKELDALEDKHREYTLAIIENKTELESLQETIKELNNEVRDMQIDLYDEVVAALEARDAAAQERFEGTISVQEAILGVIQDQADAMDDMLSHRVNMENTILGIIKAQADAERNMLSAVVNAQNTIANMIKSQADAQKNMMQARSNMENTLSNLIKTNIEAQASAEADYSSAADDANQAQIEALRQQKELLDEQLRLRKEMAEAQDKQAELAELEAQYARISADPTRLKEAMKIRQKIDKIRDEIAWDIAEKEVEEQKKAIDAQIDALSASSGGGGSSSSSSSVTYNMDEINSQVESILDTMSDEEIIEWLKDHSPDYKEATKIGKELMVQEWQAALDEMHGISEDYADEVAEVMAMSDAEMMEWFKKTSLEYQTATAERRMQLEAEWQEMLDEMHGKTETYAEEVAEVLNKPREEILQWLMDNDEEYAHASDAQKQELVDGWNETLDGMYGTSQDHWDQVNAIMAGGLESFLNFMRTNDEEYAKMSAEQKQKTEQEWTDMWNQMIGKQKSYEEEANAIIAQGQDAIIDLLGEYTSKYQNVGAQQSQAYLDEWREKLAKLKAAISDVESLETKAYEYTQPEATPEAGSGSEKAEEAKKGWRVEANWSNVFESKADAEAFKQSKISAIQDQLKANPTDANLKSRLETWKNSPISMYGKGGMNFRTGLAWLDGTPEDPERILSPYQTELFEILVHSMEEMSRVNVPMLPSFGGEFMTGGSNSSLSFGDIIVQVEHLDSDTDYDDMAEHVLDSVMEKINRSAVVGGIRFSK